jgi:hypothetical protein
MLFNRDASKGRFRTRAPFAAARPKERDRVVGLRSRTFLV